MREAAVKVPKIYVHKKTKLKLKLTGLWLSRKVNVALGFDGGVEQLACKISPGSYFVCSVHSVGDECGNSAIINWKTFFIYINIVFYSKHESFKFSILTGHKLLVMLPISKIKGNF